jgi:putative hydrolase of HD superfamily
LIQSFVDFVLEVDRLKAVTRKTRSPGQDRYENPAEHSWQIALLASALAPEVDASLDVSRINGMLLVHDLGEVDTGDTIVYATEGWAERAAAELAAVQRICGHLPPARAKHLLGLWHEFDQAQTPEARFAHAVDRAMPVLLNLANSGQSWRENGISHAQVVARIGPPIEAGCPALWRYLQPRLEDAQTKGWFGA